MIVAVIVFLGIIIAIAGAVAVWYRFRIRHLAAEEKVSRLPFRWRYIVLPLLLFVISIIMAVYFYARLPFVIAYHFTIDGIPDRWLSRELVVATGLALQLIMVLVAGAITMGIARVGMSQPEEVGIKPENILALMGNLVAFPQLVISFAMLDVFSYNSYQKHLLPLWLFMVIILILATLAFIAFSAYVVLRAGRQCKS